MFIVKSCSFTSQEKSLIKEKIKVRMKTGSESEEWEDEGNNIKIWCT